MITLQPKNFKYVKYFRNNKFSHWKLYFLDNDILYFYIRQQQVFFWYNFEYLRLLISWYTINKNKSYNLCDKDRIYFRRRFCFSSRILWLGGNLLRSYTAKAKGSRMGRGKGGLKRWKFNLRSGLIFLKLINVDFLLLYLIIFKLNAQYKSRINLNWCKEIIFNNF